MTHGHRAVHSTRFQVSYAQASSTRAFLIPQSSWLPWQVGYNMVPIICNLQHEEGWSRMRKKKKSNYDVGSTPVGQPTGSLEHLCPIRVVSKWIKRTPLVCPNSNYSLAMGCFWECWGETPFGWGKPCRADCWANCWLTLQLGVLPWRNIWAEHVTTTLHHLCHSNPFFMYAWGTSPSLPMEAFEEEALIGQIQALQLNLGLSPVLTLIIYLLCCPF